LQSHVRALVVTDAVGRVMVRSLIRLVLRSDTLTPIIFCDPMFFTVGYSRELQQELLKQAQQLERWMQVPVVHAGSVLPLEKDGELCEGNGYVRRVQSLDYDITWVELLEMDGVAPYTYSEELPYDDLLQQHNPGVQARTEESPIVVIAALPRIDSPSAERYVREREGETAWTMHVLDEDSAETPQLPSQLAAQITQREHVSAQVDSVDKGKENVVRFDPSAREWDEDTLPSNFKEPSLDY